jgi:hypothetical protein
MRSKNLTLIILLALAYLASPQIAWAQKDGEAQFVSFDENDWPTLKFSDKRSDKPICGLFVGYVLTGDQEEAFVIRVAHLHYRPRLFSAVARREVGGETLPEDGWLYITPSRIIFVVEKGDKSHAFEVPRTDLKNKPVSSLDRFFFSGLQINLRERLPASNSREQKFVFLIPEARDCDKYVSERDPYHKLLKRAVNDFNGAMIEFKRIAASLKQAGKIGQAPESVIPPGGFAPKAP